MQDLEELLAQMADARKIYGKEPFAPYHGENRVSGSSAVPRVDAAARGVACGGYEQIARRPRSCRR